MSEEYYNTKESVREYLKMAEGHNGGALIKKLLKFLPHHSHLLEIGSGPGTDWKILNRFYEVIGSDNSIHFLNHLNKSIPNIKSLHLDAITLTTEKVFDGIYSNKVLHHLNDSELQSSLARQYDILSSDGIICHSFWEGEGSEYFKGLFVNYHTETNLRNLFSVYFDILLIESYKEFETDDSLLLIAKKK